MATEARPLEPQASAAAFARIYDHVHAMEDKLRAAYPEARFELHCVADDELHLFVYSNATSIHAPMDLIEDDQDRLADQLGISLFVVPAGPP